MSQLGCTRPRRWLLALVLAVGAGAGQACDGPKHVREASLAQIETLLRERRMSVLTFAGYSGAGYQQPQEMIRQASVVLAKQDPATTLVNIGATAEGIGAVYDVAKRMGFTTMGIVSTRARDEKVPLSRCVDHVFFVKDPSWGGRVAGADRLSPTSAAIVAVSAAFVGIGGGDVARDELLAARRAGKPVDFIPADMNHRVAKDKAGQRKQPAPSEFHGSAHAALRGSD